MRLLTGLVIAAALVVPVAACGSSEQAAIIAATAMPAATATASAGAPVARVGQGMLKGTTQLPEVSGGGYQVFAGIPYAAAPTGALRWRPPAAATSWAGVRDATQYGASCPQPSAGTGAKLVQSEDCLFLNVWAPQGTTAKGRLPVMVWIHGGALIVGSGSLYDPHLMVDQGKIIVVTINYRLGALGFLAQPSLSYDGGRVGNFGFLDQQAALKWVQANIGSFGGDRGKVTIAGESGGGTSVCGHLSAPSSKGLFRAAISESGQCSAESRAQAEQSSGTYTTKLGCPTSTAAAACLRALPTAKLASPPLIMTTNSNTISAASLVGDGTTLPDASTTAKTGLVSGGAASIVPVLTGSNRNELLQVVETQQAGLTDSQYQQELTSGHGQAQGQAIYQQYPPSDYSGNPSIAYATTATDNFVCGIRNVNQTLARRAAAWQYEFADPNPPHLPGQPAPSADPHPGATHGTELSFLFDMPGVTSLQTPQEKQLSTQMIAYWTTFVTSLNPNTGGQPSWPDQPYGQQKVMSLVPGASKVTDTFTTEHHCTFWNSLG